MAKAQPGDSPDSKSRKCPKQTCTEEYRAYHSKNKVLDLEECAAACQAELDKIDPNDKKKGTERRAWIREIVAIRRIQVQDQQAKVVELAIKVAGTEGKTVAELIGVDLLEKWKK